MIIGIVLTKNEEENIKECLDGLKWCDERLVIDDDSSDNTVRIAKECGAKVFNHSLNGDFSAQRNFGLEQSKGDWILFVDADERVTKELESEIKEVIRVNKGINGYFFRRIDWFMGRFLKFGETGSIKILRLAKMDAGKWRRNVDEIWEINGRTGTLKNPLRHYSHPNLTQFLESINSRSTLNAQYLFENGGNLNLFEWSKPFFKFIQNYFLKLGFLDGTTGFVFAVLMSLHSFIVRGKLYLRRTRLQI